MFSLPKTERLCSKKLIEELFAKGRRSWTFPFGICWMPCDDTTEDCPPARVLFSVSKRRFRRAVDRNRVKRLMRECYRLHKPQLNEMLQRKDRHILLSFSYTHNEILDYATLYRKMGRIIERLDNEIKTSDNV
ncbi:MAG: ribonuclease P protein component [bacterium P3]|nr:MAG: ribonuclease P protein component [bacterium P3]KWW41497.1 MAG: ribonuclease P protein component [bacterium F083]